MKGKRQYKCKLQYLRRLNGRNSEIEPTYIVCALSLQSERSEQKQGKSESYRHIDKPQLGYELIVYHRQYKCNNKSSDKGYKLCLVLCCGYSRAYIVFIKRVLDKHRKSCNAYAHEQQQFIKFSEIGFNFAENQFHKAVFLLI